MPNQERLAHAEYMRVWRQTAIGRESARASAAKYYADNAEATKLRVKLKRYSLTLEQYEALGDSCMICGLTENLHIDHDHDCCDSEYSCGPCVRGLLCQRHNQGLGYFQDDPGALRAAAKYIETWRAR